MKNEDPLTFDPFARSIEMNRCRSGRPNVFKRIRFCSQPKSIISLQLHQEKKIKSYIHTAFTENKSDVECEMSHQDDVHFAISDEENNEMGSQQTNESDFETSKTKDESIFEKFIQPGTLNHTIKDNHYVKVDYEDEMTTANYKTEYPNKPVHRIIKSEFYCDFIGCEYKTKISTNLTKHKRIHTKEKPYLCDQCTFRSNFISSLKVHKRTHTKERPFCCEHCGYCCNSSSNLKKHWYQKHLEYYNTKLRSTD